MSNKLLFCQNCRNNMTPEFYGYWGGGYSPKLGKKCIFCKECDMVELNFDVEDYWVIRNISSDVNFLEAMIKLHDEDIIEFESRMSQFRANDEWYQKQHSLNTDSQIVKNNIPKCPNCNSTNIKPIGTGERIASVTMFGIFSKKINKSYKCLDCKYTW